MLRVDLGRLERKKRLRIDGAVTVEDGGLGEAGIQLSGPLDVELDVTATGTDVLIRGCIRGEAEAQCRRCLRAIRVPLEEAVTLLYRSGVARAEAEAEEAYPLPERERDLNLWPAIREHVILAASEYPVCREDCPGLCGRCGADLAQGACGCGGPEPDERWAALRELGR